VRSSIKPGFWHLAFVGNSRKYGTSAIHCP
jgi:hypothetical protein